MGMDGLSMSNTGALREQTSAEHANNIEQSVQANPSNDPKQVQNTSTSSAVKEKEESEQNGKKKQQGKEEEEEEFQDGLVEENQDDEDNTDDGFSPKLEDFDNPNKSFYVKLNSKDDIIELYDSSTDRLIETISGNEMQELVRRLNMASGIFVNKKV